MMLLLVVSFSSCKKEDNDIVIENEIDTPDPNINNKAVGASSNDLLSDEKYTYLEVEIVFVEGFRPSVSATENLKTFLHQRLNKPKGTGLKFASITSPGRATYSINLINEIETANRTVFTRKDTIGVYFFFADAGYDKDTDNSKVLGIAYKNTSMTLFQKTIQNLSGGLGQPERSKLETVVLNHEFGHILGLVNVGTNMVAPHQDQDASHGKHCNNEDCLMHYTVETGNVVTNLFGDNMPQLDQNCLNDLRANGGK